MTATTAERPAAGPPPAGDRDRDLRAAVDLAARILARGRPALEGADELATEVAVVAMARAGGGPRLAEATASGCLGHLVGHSGRARLAPDLLPGDVFADDVRGSDALEEELWGDGVPLAELAALLGSERRSARVTGLVVLAAGLPVGESARVLGRAPGELAEDLRHLGRRWTDRRRLGLDPDVGRPPALPDPDAGAEAAAVATAVRALDVERALAGVDARVRRRRRRRTRGLVAAGAAALLVPVAVLALGGDESPERVDAAGGPTSSTTTAPTTTVAVTTAPAPAAPPSVAPTVPVTAPSTTAAPVTAPPTTAPRTNQPMGATLEVLTPTVEAGRTATARVSWLDADLADPDVRIVDLWGDPEVFYAFPADPRPACDAPGPGGSGTRDLRFRYATPGTYTVSVVVTSCDGNGAFGERRTLTGRVEVTAPVVGGLPGRTVVALADVPTLDGESATATFTADGGGAPVDLEPRDPALPLAAPGGTGAGGPTVLRLPDGVRGELRLVQGSTCRRGSVDLTLATPAVPRVVLDQPC